MAEMTTTGWPFQQTSCPRLIDISLWRQGAETAFGGQWGGQILLGKSSSTSFPLDNKECDVFVWNKEPDPLCFDEWATWDTHLHHRVKRWERKKEGKRGDERRTEEKEILQSSTNRSLNDELNGDCSAKWPNLLSVSLDRLVQTDQKEQLTDTPVTQASELLFTTSIQSYNKTRQKKDQNLPLS